MATIDEFKQKAETIANATQVGENTAQRVGGALQDAAELIDDISRECRETKKLAEGQKSKIDDLDGHTSALQGVIASEAGARENADKELGEQIKKETRAREKADEILSESILKGLTARFNGIIQSAEISHISVSNIDGVYYISSKKMFAGKSCNRYVNNWTGADMYLNDDRTAICKDKVYLLGAAVYVWNDAEQTIEEVSAKVRALIAAQGGTISTMQDTISTLQGLLTTLQQSVTSEANARDKADKELEKKIDDKVKTVKEDARAESEMIGILAYAKGAASFEGFVDNVSLAGNFDKLRDPKVYFDRMRKTFVCKDINGVYILMKDVYGEENAAYSAAFIDGSEIFKDKVYKCKDKLYCWDDAANNLVQMGNDGSGLKIVMHNSDEHTFVLTPDALHVWPEMEQLHLTLAAAEDGYVGEYGFQFTCPEDKATNLMLPIGLEWPDKKEVFPKAGMTYRAVIFNNSIIML